MSLINSDVIPFVGGEYTIDQSLRFNDDDSAYLSRTPASAGNRKTWTWSGWVKRGNLVDGNLFSAGTDTTPTTGTLFRLMFEGDRIALAGDNTSGLRLNSEALLRDSAAEYHIMAVYDSTQSTASDRAKLYVNGAQITDFSGTTNYPAQNKEYDVNNTVAHNLARRTNASDYFDGYLSEVHFIDGQALTPSDFGETDDTYGHWKAKRYTGTYGTNGFYLDFANSGDIGNDVSGNNNDWTPTNLAATDVVLDTPTLNFATLNPLFVAAGTNNALKEGNLVADATTSTWSHAPATWSLDSGKWYWEVTTTGVGFYVGMSSPTVANTSANALLAWDSPLLDAWLYHEAGFIRHNGSNQATVATLTTGDIVGIAVDVDAGTCKFYKNNTLQYTASDDFTGWVPDVATINTVYAILNFGQDSSFAGNKTAQGNTDGNGYGDFYYSPPSGYLALCNQNLPDPAVVPSEHFNTVIYSGNGYPNTGVTNVITGVGFQPDMTWLKERATVGYHHTFDVLRGSNKALFSNGTNAEYTNVDAFNSFDADGFTLGQDTNGDGVNRDATAYNTTVVAWNWKANGSGVSNTDGSITSTVSANTAAGFSIVSYTGNGTDNATVGHGLGVKPSMLIVKKRSGAEQWGVCTESMGFGSKLMFLESTSAELSITTVFKSGTNTSTVQLGLDGIANANTATYIMLAFAEIEGYSKIGSYTGNGSTDGPFVHCGFRPAYVLAKKTDSTANWAIMDGERNAYNPMGVRLMADLSDAEYAQAEIADFTSNGFKIRGTHQTHNWSGGTYIFMAFAETDFKHSNSR